MTYGTLKNEVDYLTFLSLILNKKCISKALKFTLVLFASESLNKLEVNQDIHDSHFGFEIDYLYLKWKHLTLF